MKNVLPAIPKELELKELIEVLTRMGCEGLLTKPWNLRSEVDIAGVLVRERESMV